MLKIQFRSSFKIDVQHHYNCEKKISENLFGTKPAKSLNSIWWPSNHEPKSVNSFF